MSESSFGTIPLTDITARGLVADQSVPTPLVLVVDDEPMIADTLAEILRWSGYTAMVAYDGETAHEMVWLAPPDVVITDVCMPGMDGVQLAELIREALPECAIFLFSAYSDYLNLVTKARTEGNEFTLLRKPMAPEQLLQELKAVRPPASRPAR
jgi:YesN/AraC family two-component response regulator